MQLDHVSAAPKEGAGARSLQLAARYRYPLAVAAASRLLVYAALLATGALAGRTQAGGLTTGVLAPLGEWDAVWYRRVAEHGYDPALAHGFTAAFYPLFPLSWRALDRLPLAPVLAASLFSTLLFALALCVLFTLSRERLGEAGARRAVLYLAIFPAGFAFSLPYAESLFLLLAVAGFALARRGRALPAAAAGALAVLARPLGLVLLPALALALRGRGARRAAAYLPLALLPLAELALFAYLAWRTGDPLANPHAEARGWARGAAFPPWLVVSSFWHEVVLGHRLRPFLDVCSIVLWCALLWRACRMRLAPAELTYAGLVLLVPLLAGSLVSMARLGMVAFPLFWALADWGRERRVDLAIRIASPLLLVLLVALAYGPRTYTP